MMKPTENDVLQVVKENLPVAIRDKITLETRLFKEELIDSVGVLQIISDLQDRFNVVFEDKHLDAEVLSTPKSIYNLIQTLKKQ